MRWIWTRNSETGSYSKVIQEKKSPKKKEEGEKSENSKIEDSIREMRREKWLLTPIENLSTSL